jgi:hypothetical protein
MHYGVASTCAYGIELQLQSASIPGFIDYKTGNGLGQVLGVPLAIRSLPASSLL